MRAQEPPPKPRTLVVCGKGGVGKTTVAALICRRLASTPGSRTLAVDADHAGGLALALGLAPAETVCDVRVAGLGEVQSGTVSRRGDLALSMEYRLQAALEERGGVALLAMGRPDTPGCYCAVNGMLRKAIAQLSSLFDLTLVDAEAGLEQINRDVVGEVDLLLLVSDRSVKSVRVAEAIADLSARMGRVAQVGLLVNRVSGEEQAREVHGQTSLPLLGWIPEDEALAAADAEARSFLELPDTPASLALERALAPYLP